LGSRGVPSTAQRQQEIRDILQDHGSLAVGKIARVLFDDWQV
jgi:DeoR/GlpR family transcriptional regulator of sugar metabolism